MVWESLPAVGSLPVLPEYSQQGRNEYRIQKMERGCHADADTGIAGSQQENCKQTAEAGQKEKGKIRTLELDYCFAEAGKDQGNG